MNDLMVDHLLADLMVPGIDGVDLARRVAAGASPPLFVLITGNTLLGIITTRALPGSESTMAYLAGQGGVITCVAMSAVVVVIMVRTRTWRSDHPFDRPLVDPSGRAE